jgi:hypothetical protein
LLSILQIQSILSGRSVSVPFIDARNWSGVKDVIVEPQGSSPGRK